MPKVALFSRHVTALHRDLAAERRFQIIDKADDVSMKLVASTLDSLHIVDKQDFMERFATTATLSRSDARVYLPYTPGIPAQGWDLHHQVATIAHEAQHIQQARRYRSGAFATLYLGSPGWRRSFEVDAYKTTLYLWHLLDRDVTSSDATRIALVTLQSYSIPEEEKLVAEKHLIREVQAIQAGRGPRVGVESSVYKLLVKYGVLSY